MSAILGQVKGAARDWKAPAWLKGRAEPESEPLIANQEGAEDSHEAYWDDSDEDANNVQPSVDVPSVRQEGARLV